MAISFTRCSLTIEPFTLHLFLIRLLLMPSFLPYDFQFNNLVAMESLLLVLEPAPKVYWLALAWYRMSRLLDLDLVVLADKNDFGTSFPPPFDRIHYSYHAPHQCHDPHVETAKDSNIDLRRIKLGLIVIVVVLDMAMFGGRRGVGQVATERRGGGLGDVGGRRRKPAGQGKEAGARGLRAEYELIEG
ncbi:hypothetical protein E3N88_06520 [Mikania micrantha]|uniref:Uncharacterized protein n=1 Tax=Mikania micrantha TaxID=192012 RepID=A0A5N6PNX3_9ASTR|nr:hypothetical protein E3N88_06520 [Mikania micrantha]